MHPSWPASQGVCATYRTFDDVPESPAADFVLAPGTKPSEPTSRSAPGSRRFSDAIVRMAEIRGCMHEPVANVACGCAWHPSCKARGIGSYFRQISAARARDVSRLNRRYVNNHIELDELLARDVDVPWFEGIAMVQAICRQLLATVIQRRVSSRDADRRQRRRRGARPRDDIDEGGPGGCTPAGRPVERRRASAAAARSLAGNR